MPSNQEIRGNTLKVYLYLLKHGPSELREVQRALDLSSASLASYHLGKLDEAGYVSQDETGKYFAVKDASTKVLEGYSKVGSAVVPQLFFFSLLFTILIVFFSIEFFFGSGFTIWIIIVSIAMITVFWYETVVLWRKLTA
jgi:DNA-binding transcriptional ArsR family regulator